MSRTRILVAGAGAIGQFVGGLLWEAGHDVTLWTTARHRDAIAREGLCVRGRSNLCWDPQVVLAPPPASADLVLLTAKAHQTWHLANQIPAALGPDGLASSLQNGFGNGQKLLRVLPADRVALAITSHGVDMDRPGHLHHAGEGPTTVGPASVGHPAAAQRVHALLADARLAPIWAPDMRPPVWRKAILNHAINPVAALHGVPNGELLARPELAALSGGLLDEALLLATRARVSVDTTEARQALHATLAATAANRCSMLQDVAARRPTEVEQLSGRLVRLGERLLVSMPRSDAVYGRLKDLEGSYLGAAAATQLAWDELPFEADAF